eukprot:4691872-Prymnesium_polylepis.1
MPRDLSTYLHRVGRTGRFGSVGVSVLLLGEHELTRMQSLLRPMRASVRPLPPTFGDAGWLQQLDEADAARLQQLQDEREAALQRSAAAVDGGGQRQRAPPPSAKREQRRRREKAGAPRIGRVGAAAGVDGECGAVERADVTAGCPPEPSSDVAITISANSRAPGGACANGAAARPASAAAAVGVPVRRGAPALSEEAIEAARERGRARALERARVKVRERQRAAEQLQGVAAVVVGEGQPSPM